MSDKSSFHKRSHEDGVMSHVATAAQQMVRDAAEPVKAGETIKAQLRRAARSLGYRDGDWRIRAAWYGEAASWSATAFLELQARHREWREKQETQARAKAAVLAQLFEAIDANSPNLDRRTADLVQRARHDLGIQDRPVA